MIRAVAAALALVCSACVPASAETVYVRSGQHEGQGWTFVDATGCWAVTAGHVIDDRAGAVVVGPKGTQAQASRIVRHETLDIALLQLAGMPQRDCSSSSLGDRDEDATFERLHHRDGSMILERRSGESGITTGTSYGVEAVPMRLLVYETRPTFTVRLLEPTKDSVKKSDSGAPLRFRGAGLGDDGVPLGVVLSVQNDTITAARMDAVRAYMESLTASPATTREAPASFSIAAFTGETSDTACAPLNVLDPVAHCGWRAKQTRSNRISLTLDLGVDPRPISAVRVRFESGAVPRAIEVSTSDDASTGAVWQTGHFCRIRPDAREVTCTLGLRIVRAVRIVVDGAVAHIRDVWIVEAR